MAMTTTWKHADTLAPKMPVPDPKPVHLRRLLQNNIYLFGGHFAILCQWAHPSIAKGTALHSRFASHLAERLRNTQRFLTAAVYGSLADQRAICSVLEARHRHVRGEGYDANDPALHKWTTATLFVALVVVQDAFLGGFDPDHLERVYREAAVWGTALRMTPDMWPATLADFWSYWHHNVQTLQVTDAARTLARQLMYPPCELPMQLRLGIPLARILTPFFLPESLASAYGLDRRTAWSRWRYRAVVCVVRLTWALLPACLRRAGHETCLEDMRRSVDRIQRTGRWA